MDREHPHCSRPEVIDLISIVFESELYLLELQAKSIDLYVDLPDIANIYVVVNDNTSVRQLIDTAWWGKFQSKVKIINRDSFGVDETLHGWCSQQYYKLAAANAAESTWSMCLDAKTWFVKKLDLTELFDSTGRANFKSQPTIPVFKPAQEALEQYYNIQMPGVIGPAGVPFMFHSETVQEMIADIEQQQSFIEFFSAGLKSDKPITEFMLYSAFVIRRYSTFSTLYSNINCYDITNIADFQVPEFKQLLVQMKRPNNLTASIHLRCYDMLSETELSAWTDFLLTKHIIADAEIAKVKLNTLLNR